MQLTDALRKGIGRLRGRDQVADERTLAGPGLIEQEPDLLKEAGQHTRDSSAWAAGGQPTD